MRVERYRPDAHFQALAQWLGTRDDYQLSPRDLPRTGFVVEGLAAAFLYKTDSNTAFMEYLVGNPHAASADRNLAIDAVVEQIKVEARTLGFEILMGYSCLPAVIARAERHGFVTLPDTYTAVAYKL